MAKPKERLDRLLADRGLFESREQTIERWNLPLIRDGLRRLDLDWD